jgi:hypothetical protein
MMGQKYELIFCDFRDGNVSVQSLNSFSVLWTPCGDRPGSFPPLNPALSIIHISSCHRKLQSLDSESKILISELTDSTRITVPCCSYFARTWQMVWYCNKTLKIGPSSES